MIEPLDEKGLEEAVDDICREMDAVVISGMLVWPIPSRRLGQRSGSIQV